MVVQEASALAGDALAPERLVLQELQEVETDRVLQVGDIAWLFPILQVGQVVYEGRILHKSPLGEKVEIVWVSEALHELCFDLEPQLRLVVRLGLLGGGGCEAGRKLGWM